MPLSTCTCCFPMRRFLLPGARVWGSAACTLVAVSAAVVQNATATFWQLAGSWLIFAHALSALEAAFQKTFWSKKKKLAASYRCCSCSLQMYALLWVLSMGSRGSGPTVVSFAPCVCLFVAILSLVSGHRWQPPALRPSAAPGAKELIAPSLVRSRLSTKYLVKKVEWLWTEVAEGVWLQP